MQPLVLTAGTAISAIGRGAAAHLQSLRTRTGGLRPNDFDAVAGGWIGRVAGIEAHRLPAPLAAFDCRNNRLADLALRTDGFADAVARASADSTSGPSAAFRSGGATSLFGPVPTQESTVSP